MRLRLSLLALAAILPLFALLLVGIVIDRHLVVDTARTHALDLAQLVAERQDAAIQQANELLRVLRQSSEILHSRADCHMTLQAIDADERQFNTIGVTDADGNIVCHSLITKPMMFPDQAFFKDVMQSDPATFSISRFRIGAITGKPTIFVATRFNLKDAGEAKTGMLFATLNLDRFTAIARQFVGSSDLSVVVLEKATGTVLARVPESTGLTGKTFVDHPEMKAIAEDRDGGRVETIDFEGVERIFGFVPLPSSHHSQLIVGVGLPRAAVLADAYRRMMFGLTIAVVAAICAALAAWFLGDLWQLRPIKSLVETARKIGAGDLSARADIASWQAPEFRALGGVLNEMAANVAEVQKLLVEREGQLRLLAENATDLVFQLDLAFTCKYISPASTEILGFSPDLLIGMSPLEIIHEEDRGAVERIFRALTRGEMERASLIYRMAHRDERWIWVHSESRLLRDPRSKEPMGILGALRDITVLKTAEDALRESEGRYRLLADNVADLIISLDLDLKPVYVSPAARQLLGCEPSELEGLPLEEFTLPEDRLSLRTALHFVRVKGLVDDFRFRVQHRDKSIHWLEMSGRRPVDGNNIILVLRDITLRHHAEEQLEEANQQLTELAARDFLTGLANRRALEATLDKEYARAARIGSSLALIMIDVDRFKLFNDVYGHPAGDACLRRIAHAIKRTLQRPGDLGARYGGEEMAVLLPNIDEAGACIVAERIRNAVMALQIEHSGGLGQIATISAGVAAVKAGSGRSREDLIQAADSALYVAKSRGRNTVVCASKETVTPLQPRLRDASRPA